MNYETYILEQAAETVYDRPDSHGSPEDSFQLIADFWTVYFQTPVSPEDVAYAMILLKIARSMNGHYTEDNPVDIAGYAENAARLEHPSCYECGTDITEGELENYECETCGENPFPPVA